MLCRIALALALATVALSAHADLEVPTADAAGTRDVPWLKRYEGSVAVAFSAREFDEYLFAEGPLKQSADEEARDGSNNRMFEFTPSRELEGQRTRIVYLLPEGRSTLEAVRGYEQEIEGLGGVKKFECKADGCGGDPKRNSDGGGGWQSVAMKLWPESRVTEAPFTLANCAQTMSIADQRLASFEIPGNGFVQVHAFIGTDTQYCEVFNGRTIAVVDVLETKPREQKMVTVSAGEMQKALSATGRVALYGIYFDTASATIRPDSKPTLDEIGKLLSGDPTMKIHVVGHTDSQGGLDRNFDLSKRRAAAVRDALVRDYGIAAARLTANGVSYLAPVASNADDAGRAKNRRVELVPF